MANSNQCYELQHSLCIDSVLIKIMLPFSIHKTAQFHQKQPPETMKTLKIDETGAATCFSQKSMQGGPEKNVQIRKKCTNDI